jgi:hypothetical protein
MSEQRAADRDEHRHARLTQADSERAKQCVEERAGNPPRKRAEVSRCERDDLLGLSEQSKDVSGERDVGERDRRERNRDPASLHERTPDLVVVARAGRVRNGRCDCREDPEAERHEREVDGRAGPDRGQLARAQTADEDRVDHPHAHRPDVIDHDGDREREERTKFGAGFRVGGRSDHWRVAITVRRQVGNV